MFYFIQHTTKTYLCTGYAFTPTVSKLTNAIAKVKLLFKFDQSQTLYLVK